MRTKLPFLVCAILSFAGCSAYRGGTYCVRESVRSTPEKTLDISFRRRHTSQSILVHLAWALPSPPFYTRYGPLQEVTIRERNNIGSVAIKFPKERLSHIEDFWPDLIILRSPYFGSYELSIPTGVPNPVPEILSTNDGSSSVSLTATDLITK